MSYINDALKKAQRERDGRYERFGGIIAPTPGGPGRLRRRRIAVGAAVVLVVLIPAGLLLALYGRQQPPPAGVGNPPPIVAGSPAVPVAPAPQTAGTEAPGKEVANEVPAVARGEKEQPAGNRTPAELYKEALSAQRKGDSREAERLYRKILALDPGHVQSLNNLGVISMAEKRREQAISLFGKAIILKKDYVDPYYNLACLYAQTNEIDESMWYLKVAATINGDVKTWAERDADLKNVVSSPAFKKIMEGQKN